MQRRGSMRYGSGRAPVGQARRQASQEPQWSSSGGSAGSSSVVNTSPRNSHEPKRRETRLVCLPIQPSPARIASGFSITGAVSTNTLTAQPCASASQPANAFRRFFSTSW